MENIRFEIRFKRRFFLIAVCFLIPSILFGVNKIWIPCLGFLGCALLILLISIWNYFKFQKLKQFCNKIDDNTFEIPLSKIKEIIPINIWEYSIITQDGNFNFTSNFVNNFRKVENLLFKKMEEEPFLIIETPVTFNSVILVFVIIYDLISVFIFNNEANWKFSVPTIIFLSMSFFLITDLVFKTTTNSFFKKFIKIPKEDILSFHKSNHSQISIKTKNRTMRLWSNMIGNHRIEGYLVRNGITNTANKQN